MSAPIYLDYNASTPVLGRVAAAMVRALEEGFANPSAGHAYGKRARSIVEAARAQVAGLLGCDTDEIIFTSGGTEANNLALRGFSPDGPLALVTSEIEHPAVTEPAAGLARSGAKVTAARVGGDGVVDVGAMRAAIDGAPRGRSVLVTLMLAQNETGVIQPVGEVAKMARDRGAMMHTDAAQAIGKIPVDVRDLGVDLLSVAGHKLYAPKGVGALYVRRGVKLSPLMVGASHERGLRPGTENVAGIAALGEACSIAREDLEDEAKRQLALRSKLEALLSTKGFVVHGAGADRLPNTVNGRFPGVRGSSVLARAGAEVAFTTGSACHAGEESPSPVLSAMGIEAEAALGAIRLTLGRLTTLDEIELAAAAILRAV